MWTIFFTSKIQWPTHTLILLNQHGVTSNVLCQYSTGKEILECTSHDLRLDIFMIHKTGIHSHVFSRLSKILTEKIAILFREGHSMEIQIIFLPFFFIKHFWLYMHYIFGYRFFKYIFALVFFFHTLYIEIFKLLLLE